MWQLFPERERLSSRTWFERFLSEYGMRDGYLDFFGERHCSSRLLFTTSITKMIKRCQQIEMRHVQCPYHQCRSYITAHVASLFTAVIVIFMMEVVKRSHFWIAPASVWSHEIRKMCSQTLVAEYTTLWMCRSLRLPRSFDWKTCPIFGILMLKRNPGPSTNSWQKVGPKWLFLPKLC